MAYDEDFEVDVVTEASLGCEPNLDTVYAKALQHTLYEWGSEPDNDAYACL